MTEQNENSVNMFDNYSTFTKEKKREQPLIFNYTKCVNKDMVIYYLPFEVINPEAVVRLEAQGFHVNTNKDAKPDGDKTIITVFPGETKTGRRLLVDNIGAAAILNYFTKKGMPIA